MHAIKCHIELMLELRHELSRLLFTKSDLRRGLISIALGKHASLESGELKSVSCPHPCLALLVGSQHFAELVAIDDPCPLPQHADRVCFYLALTCGSMQR